jgi:cellulose synthase/poly-beta-1,6-N-acetylglucosamine synthase-like glycosyltransferase
MDLYVYLNVLDWVIYIIVAMSVLYLLLYGIASKFYHNPQYPDSEKMNRILVLFPAYREDNVIISSVQSFLLQEYPKDLYELVVISDHMQEETNEKLKQLPITFLEVTFEQSSKAKALNFALENFENGSFDIVTILDADNIVDPFYLKDVNNAFASGVKVLQAHRIAKNLQTDVAVFDAVSEEVNHSIFRKGHCALGLSSALVGSGMAFDYKWFRENVVCLKTAGEDKELEILLLKQSVKIEYADKIYVRDEKTSKGKVYFSQRQRWLSAQYNMLVSNFRNIPMCFRTRNLNYFDKIIQWMLLPRAVMFGLTGLMTLFLLIISWEYALKWFILLFLLMFIFALTLPGDLLKIFIKRSWKTVPALSVMMFLNFFKIKKGKKFIHTPHGQE